MLTSLSRLLPGREVPHGAAVFGIISDRIILDTCLEEFLVRREFTLTLLGSLSEGTHDPEGSLHAIDGVDLLKVLEAEP